MSGNYKVPAVERAFAMLELISVSQDGLRMSDLTRKMSIPKSSAFGLLRSLEDLGYVQSGVNGRYSITSKLHRLSQTAAGDNSIQALARPSLQKLSARLNLTVHLAELIGNQSQYVDRITVPGLVKFDTEIGKLAPAQLTAVGKSMLAHLPPADVAELFTPEDFIRGTERAPKSFAELEQQLRSVVSLGFAFEDQEEVSGVRCLASAITTAGGELAGAIGCIGLVEQISDNRIPEIASELDAAAQEIKTVLAERNYH